MRREEPNQQWQSRSRSKAKSITTRIRRVMPACLLLLQATMVALVHLHTATAFSQLDHYHFTTITTQARTTGSSATRRRPQHRSAAAFRKKKNLPHSPRALNNIIDDLRHVSYNLYTTTCLQMATKDGDNDNNSNNNNNNNKKPPPSEKKPRPEKPSSNSTAAAAAAAEDFTLKRITQLEHIVARQEVQIQKLIKECQDLTEAAGAFARVVELLRQAGLDTPAQSGKTLSLNNQKTTSTTEYDDDDDDENTPADVDGGDQQPMVYETYDDVEIFGRAPSSVIDAADAAGAAILAGMLGGKQRMLVDVRDAELSRDPETLVQFVELAILPVAAGLEGLKSARNRVKIVFPTVSQLLQYRRTMALSAPEVVALSTLGFDPIEKKDQLVVLVAPSPDDEEGLAAMNELLSPTDPAAAQITQPLVVVNYHMVPVSGPAKDFEVAYHLRLLSVQYMSGQNQPEYLEAYEEHKRMMQQQQQQDEPSPSSSSDGEDSNSSNSSSSSDNSTLEEDEALEAAMKHAHEIGMNQGVTRAMVIRAYPKPWHVFVDTSPDTDADFEVAATFDEEPSQDDVNFAIVECLEGSEREDELVAQQMQQALEAGQLDKVSEMLGISPIEVDAEEKKSLNSSLEDDGDDETFYNDFGDFEEDSC